MQNVSPIVAIATAPGRGGVGVIRLSGPDLSGFIFPLMQKKALTPRYATYTNFYAADGSIIDSGLALYFPGPNSFTGEDVLELQGHGGPVILNMLQTRCTALGARLAEPGEFTKRAFLNDKMDLAQAESVADLIDASSEAAARSAVRSLQGAFSREIHQLVDQLIHLRMLVEATLDFPEEEIDFLEAANARGQLQAIQAQLARVLDTASQGSLLREGAHIVLVGQPNVGKSSLLNALVGFEAAIVTDIAGTTRDTVRELIHLNGVPIHIVDTAGLRQTEDTVEKIGIARTWSAIEKADMVLLLVDSQQGIQAEDEAILAELPAHLPKVQVYNKIDLVAKRPEADTRTLYLSAKTGEGLSALKDTLLEMVGWHQTDQGVFMARERHLDAIRRAAIFLEEAATDWQQVEIFAEMLRMAQSALSEITGEFSADDLLGEIFSRFCIGK
jgi:tRNA modification GTPase